MIEHVGIRDDILYLMHALSSNICSKVQLEYTLYTTLNIVEYS